MTQELQITRPDDWHLHLRDGAEMASVLSHTARCFARAIVMPNLKPPVVTTTAATTGTSDVTTTPAASPARALVRLMASSLFSSSDTESSPTGCSRT